jgi:hypothetical protein
LSLEYDFRIDIARALLIGLKEGEFPVSEEIWNSVPNEQRKRETIMKAIIRKIGWKAVLDHELIGKNVIRARDCAQRLWFSRRRSPARARALGPIVFATGTGPARTRTELDAFAVATGPRLRMTRNDTEELGAQVREWERDERDRIAREQGHTNTVLGPDGVYHHRDHLGPVLARTTDDTLTMNEDTENDQTLAQNEGAELTGHQLTELGEITSRVDNHFTTEALGHPSDMQISSDLSWS